MRTSGNDRKCCDILDMRPELRDWRNHCVAAFGAHREACAAAVRGLKIIRGNCHSRAQHAKSNAASLRGKLELSLA